MTKEEMIMTKSRRHFLQHLASGALAIPLASIGYAGMASAADMPKVDPQDATAIALGYVNVAPNPSKRCHDCQLYKGSGNNEWGPCPVFPGKLVNSGGWCSAWSA